MTQSKMNPPTALQSAIGGGAAGAIESLFTYPTEYIKTRQQLHGSKQSPVRILVSTLKTSGVGALYTGVSSFIVSNAAKSGVRFMTFDYVRNSIPKDPVTGKPTSKANMIAGMASGVAEGISVVTPRENVKTRLIEDQASGVRTIKTNAQAIRAIVAERGLRGFYRGATAVTMKHGSNELIRFTSYNYMLDYLRPALEGTSISALAPSICGAAAGVVTVYCTMPFDVVKTRMQMASRSAEDPSTTQVLKQIVQKDGVRGLWRGTTPRIFRLSIAGAMIFSIYEQTVGLLQRAERPMSVPALA